MSMYYVMNINISAIGTPNTISNVWAGIGAAIYAHIETLTMLFNYSTPMFRNNDRGVNGFAHVYCFSRIRVNYHD